MSRRSRISTRRKPRQEAFTNNMAIAMAKAAKIKPADVARQRGIIEQALADFTKGLDCPLHWRSLVDTANMARTLADMGLGSGRQADQVIDDALASLHAVHQRHAQRGTWTLYPREIDALTWLVRLHGTVQLPACSYGEFERAMNDTGRRLQQALAGNAAPGSLVVAGDLVKTVDALIGEARP
jgi:hypothetical protein